MPPRLTQSFSGRIREHLEEIEARLSVGVPRAGVVAEFKRRGVELGTLQSFPSALYRARRAANRVRIDPLQVAQMTLPQVGGAPAAAAPTSDPLQPLPVAQPKEPLEREFKYGAHDPRRIDEVLRNPRDMEALRKRGLEMAREHAKKKA